MEWEDLDEIFKTSPITYKKFLAGGLASSMYIFWLGDALGPYSVLFLRSMHFS